MIQSFRLRLALLSALHAGFALVAFGLGSIWLICNIKIERIDNEVKAHAEREVIQIRTIDEWQDAEAQIASDSAITDDSDLLLLVQDSSGEVIYRSAHWPSDLDIVRLPWTKKLIPQESGRLDLSLFAHAFAAEEVSDTTLLPAEQRPDFRRPPPRRFRPENQPPPPKVPRRDEVDVLLSDSVKQQDAQFTKPADFASGQTAPTIVRTEPSLDNERVHEKESSSPPSQPISLNTSMSVDGQQWRIGLASNNQARVAVAINADMKGIRNAFFIALPLSLILIALGSWIFSSRAMQPLQKLTAATRKVTAEGLNQRISVQGEDREFVELIEVYNRMLERLERSFKQAHRFSADAAHELKTPLAILQGQLEQAIGAAESGSPLQAELTSILDEVRRLSSISRKLLMLSQADAGHLKIHREPFDLSKALLDLIEDTQMLAPNLKVSGKTHPGLSVLADGSLLRQVLHNLISNAIKYNVEGGWIDIFPLVWPQRIEVQVANSSPGIPAASRGKIFERFYRADPAHGRNIEGVGLGLSVSCEIARAHGGDIIFKTDDDGSLRFSLLLPINPNSTT